VRSPFTSSASAAARCAFVNCSTFMVVSSL
jgi:hypothetical protein